jgi:hypothetical protein
MARIAEEELERLMNVWNSVRIGGAGACPAIGEGSEVVLRDFCLDGTAHFLPEGSDLTVVNDGAAQHDYVAVDGSFGTGLLQPGEQVTVARPTAGVHRVRCTLHSTEEEGMAGVLIVGEHEPAVGGAGAGGAAAPAVTAWPARFPPLAGWLTTILAGVALMLALAALRTRTPARVPER